MNREARRAKINRANKRRQRREESLETEPEDNKNYSVLMIAILLVGILSGYFLYEQFMVIEVIASLNKTLATILVTSFLVVLLFMLGLLFLCRQLKTSKRLIEILYFGLAIGVIIGVSLFHIIH